MSIDGLRSQEKSAKRKIDDYEEQQEIVRNKIVRLKEIKKRIGNDKDEVSEQQFRAQNLITQYGWVGSNYEKHHIEVEERYKEGFQSFHNQTDDAEEAINWKITELENESRDIDGWIGDTLNWLNDILTRIQIFFD